MQVGRRAVHTAIATNAIVLAGKMGGFLVTGSASVLSEVNGTLGVLAGTLGVLAGFLVTGSVSVLSEENHSRYMCR